MILLPGRWRSERTVYPMNVLTILHEASEHVLRLYGGDPLNARQIAQAVNAKGLLRATP